jgi:hypothetical protein
VKVGKAILAGIIGGLAMTALAWLARATGIDLNGEMMLGTMTGNAPGPGTWTVGLMMHLVLSALIALLYAAGFEGVTRRAGAGIGLGFSLVHIIIGGVVMGMIQAVHPMIPEQMPAPGAFLMNMGPTIVALFVVEHLMYGTIVGALYGAVLHPAAPRTTVLRSG